MCGIAGAVGLTAEAVPDSDRVARMTDMLAHRGPDAAGHWCSDDRRVQFGHRRLSVIDLATGAQPMSDETGRFTLVFNGEIYNYRELRSQLLDDGVRLRTESDTEVLLQLLMRDWDQAVHHLIGMFAFAVWDDRRRRLLIARDRIGEKPLYFMQDQDSLYFASTFHALYATCRNKHGLDIAGLDDFLTLGYVPAPRTIASGIAKLPAGALLLADDSGSVEVRRYWSIAQGRTEFEGSYEQAVDALEEKLQDSVRIRLRSDVPLGVFLSGGVDSSLVAALAARESAGRLQTFSIGFDEARFDETAAARSVADHVGAEHHVFRARFDIVDLLPQIVRHYGEPFGDPSALPVWMLAQETRRHVTVAIGGDGGDEGFGGYEWYWTAARLRRLRALVPERGDALWTRAMDRATRYSHRLAPFQRGLALIMSGDAERFASLRSFVGPVEAATLYAGELAAHRMVQPTDSQRRFADIFGDATGSHLHRMRVVDIETYLADCLMPKVDIATMAHGLEARAPLLDPDLLQFALSLPDRWIANGRGGKRILKDVLGRLLPTHLFERPKQGFTVPLETWFNRDLKTRIAGLAASDVLNELDLLRSQGIAALVAEHGAGRRDHSQRLYNLLVLEEWLRQNS